MDATHALAQHLRTHVNPDGGWGYTPGARSRVEPTSWAILALSAADAGAAGWSPAPALQFLRSTRTSRGLLADVVDGPPNYAFSALAALASRAASTGDEQPWVRAVVEGIAAGRGVALRDDGALHQRSTLQAWPWIDGCFSWVEPTAWCLLLLKPLRAHSPDRRLQVRIEEAERLLFDRCCEGGGWNYGNAAVLEQSLDPFVPTTSMALLALQDRPDHPLVSKSLAWLQAHARREPSGMALALALISFARYRVSVAELEAALAAQYARSGFLGQVHVTAMALYTLTAGRTGAGAFHV